MELRLVKVAVAASIAAFCLLVAFNNLADYQSNYTFVGHVLSMDTTFPGNVLTNRAITDPRLWQAAYAAIIAAEALSGFLIAAGAFAMARRLKASAAAFEAAKALAYLGCGLAVLLWFFGFMVIAGEYFLMWQSREWNAQASATRIVLTVLGALVLIALPEREQS